ncbi:hypothetical protein SAMN02745226_01656 [Fervidobacterium gondwanense DSM 13020]|uniref:Uncharacterized protein n=1 Tax=Fervidobacterium gondwanense DSM 13020 TaxID=1121883 RepID=A0A1M7T793_FERGO|nr:hypothetical protein SAMN02745226_01656 [Fervidobacterium gondwanense DSM 13020]
MNTRFFDDVACKNYQLANDRKYSIYAVISEYRGAKLVFWSPRFRAFAVEEKILFALSCAISYIPCFACVFLQPWFLSTLYVGFVFECIVFQQAFLVLLGLFCGRGIFGFLNL